MPAANRPPDDADDLLGSLSDLGRRIDEAKLEADRRTDEPAPGRFPVAWLAVALLVAIVAGGMVLASSDDDDVASGGPPTTAAPAVSVTSTSAGVAAGEPTSTTEAPTTTAAPTTTEAPTTTVAPTTTAPPTTATTAPPTTTTTAPPATPAPTSTPTPAPNVPTGFTETTVEPGGSFWSIADQVLSERLGRPATDGEITGFWAQFVAANADRFVEPGNPNLLHPGQVLVLPGGTG